MGLPLLAMSGAEVALALQRAGYRVRERSEVHVVLARGLAEVTVPLGASLHRETLFGILRVARLSYAELLDHLEGLSPTGPTSTGVHLRVRLR